MAGSRGPMSAADLMAENERRLREDPEYRAAVEKAEADLAVRLGLSLNRTVLRRRGLV